jgi:hypothetical protein
MQAQYNNISLFNKQNTSHFSVTVFTVIAFPSKLKERSREKLPHTKINIQ